MSLRNRRIFRHEGRGVRWSVEPVGGELQIEIVFDGEPDETIRRTRPTHELDGLIAAQLQDGFIAEPPWEPSVAWIKSASDRELALEVLDAWSVAVDEKPATFPALPPAVRAFVSLEALAVQSFRNGLAAFIVESDPQLVAHVPAAARILGVPDVAGQFEAATAGMDFQALHGTIPAKLRWASPRDAKKLQTYASMELDRVLRSFVRAHAQEFVPLPVEGRR